MVTRRSWYLLLTARFAIATAMAGGGAWLEVALHLHGMTNNLAIAAVATLMLVGPLRGPWSYSGYQKKRQQQQ